MHIHRDQLDELKKWYDEPEALIILGPRQVGKTTLVHDFLAWAEEYNMPKNRIFSYNLDRSDHKSLLADQAGFVETITAVKGKKIVFIDEIQRLKDPGIFLKGLIDTVPDTKFIVTGSSSLEIRSKIADVLTGRKHVIELSPLSYNEAQSQVNYPLSELLVRGGYPAVFTTQNQDKKMARLNEIVNSYIETDIKDFLGIEYIDKYTKLMTLLSGQVGGLINHAHLTSVLSVHLTTLERYLSILQNTFILDLIYPFSRNPSREITKAPVPYFLDNGIRNYFLGNFQPIELRNDRGLLFENFVYTQLRQIIPPWFNIHYWRSKDKKEVDFIVGHQLTHIPVEVKYKEYDSVEITTSMKAFIQMYNPPTFVVVNLSLAEQTRWNTTDIYFTPIHRLTETIQNLTNQQTPSFPAD